jgi:hypothetical protein
LNALGRHLLIELQDCNKEVLNDPGYIRDAMVGAAIDCGAVVLGESFHHFSPQGVAEWWSSPSLTYPFILGRNTGMLPLTSSPAAIPLNPKKRPRY